MLVGCVERGLRQAERVVIRGWRGWLEGGVRGMKWLGEEWLLTLADGRLRLMSRAVPRYHDIWPAPDSSEQQARPLERTTGASVKEERLSNRIYHPPSIPPPTHIRHHALPISHEGLGMPFPVGLVRARPPS